MMLPTVSVVMATYRRRKQLNVSVSALLEQPEMTELIVVIDGDDDGSLADLQLLQASDQRVRPALLPNNVGRHRARQKGIELATCDVVTLLDDDVVASAGLIAGHARHHAKDPNLVSMGYMPVDLKPQASWATKLYALEYEGYVQNIESSRTAVLSKLWGGNVSIRREHLLSIGFLSPEGSLDYHEDMDFGIRCAQAGLVGIFDRSLRAAHLHERTAEQFLTDAYAQGRDRTLVTLRHQHAVPAYDAETIARSAPVILRPLLRIARHTFMARSMTTVLTKSTRALPSIAPAIGKFQRLIQQQQGALAAQHESKG